MKQLTEGQIYGLTEGKKPWYKKKKHLIKLAKNFGIIINNDDELKYLIEVHCDNELKRHEQKFMNKSKKGELRNNYTPTDIKGGFEKVEEPIIGRKYHISWAYCGAVFVLQSISEDTCYLRNPKYNKEKIITCKINQLRNLKSKS